MNDGDAHARLDGVERLPDDALNGVTKRHDDPLRVRDTQEHRASLNAVGGSDGVLVEVTTLGESGGNDGAG